MDIMMNPTRPDRVAVSKHGIRVVDDQGVEWIVRSAKNGPGIEVMLAIAPDGTSDMVIRPMVGNVVHLIHA